MIFKKLFRSNANEPKEQDGIVWAKFNRKYETWHFGPEDEKRVIYDGFEKGALYRFIDEENDSGQATSYDKGVRGNYEIELIADDIDPKWKDKYQDEKVLYLVAEGSWDGNNLRYKSPVLVVEKPVFKKLKEKVGLANDRSGVARPNGLHTEMRKR